MKILGEIFAVLSLFWISGVRHVAKVVFPVSRKAGLPMAQNAAIAERRFPPIPILLVCCLGFFLVNPANGAVIADSFDDWSSTGTQGENNWYSGYYNQTLDVNGTYETADFIPFLNDGSGSISPTNHWDISQSRWLLTEFPADTLGPWTSIGQSYTHPNGINSNPPEEHWTIRRWLSSVDGPVDITWDMSKFNPNGSGVTGLLFVNGLLVDSASIDGNDTTGVSRSVSTLIAMSDIIELALSPTGPSGDRSDGADGSTNRLTINAVPVPAAVWLFGTALIGFVGMSRRRKVAQL